jgi:RNA polymerase sigma-70 factor (ECF subfamily)
LLPNTLPAAHSWAVIAVHRRQLGHFLLSSVSDNQAELVKALEEVAGGDRDAFRLLYERTAPKLLATIRRILGSGSAAEDAVQEAFIRIWRNAASFDASIASPIAWMTTIARHTAIDVLRSAPEKVAAASTTIDENLAERLAAVSASADPLASGRLSSCLGKLEADRRGMVVLAYCYGWSREELAARFGRPVATIKTVLRRSLMTLKECLGGN